MRRLPVGKVVRLSGFRVILGLYGDNGKENGNYYIIIWYILGLSKDSGKESGNYYIIIGYILELYGAGGKEHGNHYRL